jgi:hypothetical protein
VAEGRERVCLRAAVLALAMAMHASAQQSPDTEEWIPLFNGRDLEGWIPKVRGVATGENYANTFRVVDGALSVAYDGYTEFDERFGHIFYKQPFSHYRVRFEYRFIGPQAPAAPKWAFRNSGIMLHSQPPQTMGIEQDFPISIEFQLLGGKGDGKARPTGNMCSPGTEVSIGGKRAWKHCVEADAPTLDGDQWVKAEALVLGSERVVHYINGQPVIEYGGITMGGGMVSGHRKELKHDDEPLAEGYLSLQSEGHPIQFRNVELLNLEGCMDPKALNYQRYYVAADAAACRY